MTIEQPGDYNKEEWDALIDKITANSSSVYVEVEVSGNKFEGALDKFKEWVNTQWLKRLGIGNN
ncbi:hypothetical protein [Spirosoma foliorum]|nr:hypothetical protein [Spirosoma foliorum]